MNDTELIAQFELGVMDMSRFDHEAHLRLAWAYLRREPLPEVMIKMRDGLKGYTAKLGVPEKYHETITFSFILLLHQRQYATTPAVDFETFIQEEKDLSLDWQQLLKRWYCSETLDSITARQRFCLPDLLASAPT